jgi:membrane protease YdiL (CAAX protease family)
VLQEEIVYRGLVYGFFQDKQRHQPLSMLLSSTLYGFFHVTYLYAIGLCSGIFYSWLQVFFQYLIAVFYTLQFVRTGSLMEPILLSLTQNFFFTLYPSSRHFSIVAPVYIFQGTRRLSCVIR